MTKVAVMSAGSWGTAFAFLLAKAGCTVTMWARRQDVVDQINSGVNRDYLPDLELPATIRATADPEEACHGAELVTLAVPSQTLRANLIEWGKAIPVEADVVSLMKGVELGTTMRMSEVIEQVAGITKERIVVVSGPNLAKEIALQQPAASTVACIDPAAANRVAAACASEVFRPHTTHDVLGAEI